MIYIVITLLVIFLLSYITSGYDAMAPSVLFNFSFLFSSCWALAIHQACFPITQFFIWGDDVEFTQRMVKAGFSNYFVSDSIVLHKMKANIGTNIIDETHKSRIKRYYYANINALHTK